MAEWGKCMAHLGAEMGRLLAIRRVGDTKNKSLPKMPWIIAGFLRYRCGKIGLQCSVSSKAISKHR